MSSDEGRVIAAGRASEIVDLGGGRVFRRFKSDGDPVHEAEVMNLARRSGYPVPRVDEVRPDGLVLEFVDGRTMADDARDRPELVAEHARTLAQLHDELHRIQAADGKALLHLDLHCRNVLMSQRGPVVIDWANAANGDPNLDPALTWVILMTSSGPTGEAFAREFERHIDVGRALEEAVRYRLRDRNLTAPERARVRQLASPDDGR